jgi:apolipoprotein N-acyltransferase
MPGREIPEPYRKQILVPFGEYIPLEKYFSWPSWLVPKLYKTVPGGSYRFYAASDGTRFSPIVCWENLFAGYVRPMVKEGTQVIVQLTNDNWFGRTAAPYQHNLASVMRAVENRVPVVIASNTGPSQIIDSHGRVLAGVKGLFQEGAAETELRVGKEGTFYTRNGDFFVWGCIALVIVGAGVGFLRSVSEKGGNDLK